MTIGLGLPALCYLLAADHGQVLGASPSVGKVKSCFSEVEFAIKLGVYGWQ